MASGRTQLEGEDTPLRSRGAGVSDARACGLGRLWRKSLVCPRGEGELESKTGKDQIQRECLGTKGVQPESPTPPVYFPLPQE